MKTNIIDEYEAGAGLLREAMAGLTPEQLNAHPVPGTWSIQQIVMHLMDSDLIWTDRAKRMIAEDNPLLIGYDESRFAANLHYDQQDVADAITIFELNRRQFARVLRNLPAKAFERTGVHNERGTIQLGQSIESITWHVGHHVEFARQKRAMLGK